MENNDIKIDDSQCVYSTECNWVQDIPVMPINDFEKKMLEGTKNTDELLKEEKEESEKPVEVSDDVKQKQKKNDYINKIKVISLDKLALYPLANPSTFPQRLKQKVMDMMRETIDYYGDDEEKLTNDFNTVCLDKLFDSKMDYSRFPVYK